MGVQGPPQIPLKRVKKAESGKMALFGHFGTHRGKTGFRPPKQVFRYLFTIIISRGFLGIYIYIGMGKVGLKRIVGSHKRTFYDQDPRNVLKFVIIVNFTLLYRLYFDTFVNL